MKKNPFFIIHDHQNTRRKHNEGNLSNSITESTDQANQMKEKKQLNARATQESHIVQSIS